MRDTQDDAAVTQAKSHATYGMNDFALILEQEGRQFAPADALREHGKSVSWLAEQLYQPRRIASLRNSRFMVPLA